MLQAASLAALQLAAYDYPDAQGKISVFPWDWQTLLNGQPAGFRFAGVSDVVVIIPGTRTLEQWKLDFEALAETTDHPTFGRIAVGFWVGIETFANQLLGALARQAGQRRVTIIGHSRGAAQAPLVAALLGKTCSELMCFAPPRVGCGKFQRYMQALGIPTTLYRNKTAEGHDYVTDVPFTLPGLEPYEQIAPLTDVSAEPLPDDTWGPLRWHHMGLYAEALGVPVPRSVLRM